MGTIVPVFSCLVCLYCRVSKISPKQLVDKITMDYAFPGEIPGQLFNITPYYSLMRQNLQTTKSIKGNVGAMARVEETSLGWDVLDL
jgi:hypothetical protein